MLEGTYSLLKGESNEDEDLEESPEEQETYKKFKQVYLPMVRKYLLKSSKIVIKTINQKFEG
jgi:hypothetical protein